MTSRRSKNVSNAAEVRLDVRLLGAPLVSLYGEPVKFRSRKVLALFVFLVLEGGVHRRERLVDLLWPDSTGSRGHSTLRSTLSRLRESLGEAADVLQAETIGVQITLGDHDRVDVDRLRSVVDAMEVSLEDTDGLVAGPFLEGFSVDGSPDFDDWMASWAATCQGASTALYDRLSEQALRHGRLDIAEELGAAWQRLAPFDDGPVALLIEVDARRGARASALERFARYSDLLQSELGAQPGAALAVLADRVRGGDLAHSSPEEAIRRHLDEAQAALDRGDAREAVVALDQAAPLLRVVGPAGEAEFTLPVLGTRARALELCGRYGAARDDYQRLIDRSADHQELTWRLRGLVGLAVLHATPTALASFELAAECADAALDLSRLVGDREAEALARWAMLLVAHYGRGDEAAALDHATHGIAAARSVPDSPTLPRLLNDLHWVHAARGNLAAARESLDEAIEGWERLGDHSMLADSLNGAVLLATLGGDFDGALSVAARGTELAQGSRNLWNQLAINANLGLLRRELGQYDQGISALRAACDVAADEMPVARVFYQLTLAVLLGDLGLGDRVEALCGDVETVNIDLPGFWMVPETLTTLRIRGQLQGGTVDGVGLDTVAEIAGGTVGLSLTSVLAPAVACATARRLGQPDRAVEIASRYLESADKAGVELGRPEILLEVASAQLALGAADDAAATLAQALAAADEIGSKRTRWRLHVIRTRLEREAGNEAEAAREHVAYLDERAKILAEVPGPDRESFAALITTVADRALPSGL